MRCADAIGPPLGIHVMVDFAVYVSRQVIKIFFNIIFAIAYFIPKKNNLILFGAWFGKKYSDNPKYIFEYALSQPSTEVFWVSKDKKLVSELVSKGCPAVFSLSLAGVWLQLRAKVIVFSHSHWSEFTPWLISTHTKRVQVWHGAPLKKIGLDDIYSRKNRARSFIKTIIYPYLRERFDLVLATGNMDSDIFRSAFNVGLEKIDITGYARNDVFSLLSSALSAKPKNILYLPTFRGAPGSVSRLFERPYFDGDAVNKALSVYGAKISIKLHPAQALSPAFKAKVLQWENIQLIGMDKDIYSVINDYDALVTDYSSVYFDYLLSGYPIYMLSVDLDEYLATDRKMYYRYSDIIPSAPMVSWPDLINYIYLNDYPRKRHIELLGKVHKFVDRNSAQRSYESILKNLIN